MDENILVKVKQTLANYLEENHFRKTPERFAILEAVYKMNGHFTLEELGARMEQDNFRVSRATLYNAINLFLKLRIVVRHNFQQGTKYEASFHNDNHCHQICTICGKVDEVPTAHFIDAVSSIKLKRFHQMGFSLYIYGICSKCQAKITRKKTKTNKPRNISKKLTMAK
jgi:Fur family ferric uptake transcriptional regulator